MNMPAQKRKTVSFIVFVSIIFFNLSIAWSGSEVFLSTDFDGLNSQSGQMFNLTNISSQTITLTGNFEGKFYDHGTTAEVQVWYRHGTYEGSEPNPEDWSILGTAQVTPPVGGGKAAYSIDAKLTIEPGEIIGMFFYFYNETTAVKMYYSDDAHSFNDGNLKIDTGALKGIDLSASSPPTNGDAPVGGGTTPDRTWNGSIGYTTGGNTTIVPPIQLLLLND